MKVYSFSKKEKLKSRKAISSLFDLGMNSFSYPLKVFYIVKQVEYDAKKQLPKIGVSVSKRKFKNAVDRNLLKRRIKEAYRLNKYILTDAQLNLNFEILFVYISDQEEEYLSIEKGMKKILKSIINGCKSH
jgi:ribonuclease P protein component